MADGDLWQRHGRSSIVCGIAETGGDRQGERVANADLLKELRIERQEQLNGLTSMRGNSTALSALTRRAQAVTNEASGLRIVADIGQKPLDQQAELDAIRKSVSQPETAGESALERLKRLSGKTAA